MLRHILVLIVAVALSTVAGAAENAPPNAPAKTAARPTSPAKKAAKYDAKGICQENCGGVRAKKAQRVEKVDPRATQSTAPSRRRVRSGSSPWGEGG